MTQSYFKNPQTSLIIAFATCFGTAAIGAAASINAADFYQQLTQPSWAPPATVFGPVWTGLYALMAISFWLILRSPWNAKTKAAVFFFVTQLALNALWSWLFFAWHKGGFALLELVILWLLILLTIIQFWRITKVAGALLIPYLLWVSFAGFLNLTMWQLNPVLLG